MKDKLKPAYFIEVWSDNDSKINFCKNSAIPMRFSALGKNLDDSKKIGIKTIAVWYIYPRYNIQKYYLKSYMNSAIIFADRYHNAVIKFKKMYPKDRVIDWKVIK